MSATSTLLTFAEFEKMPDDGKRYELRHGELVALPPAKSKHYFLQLRIQALLQQALAPMGMAGVEFPFRPLPEVEFWRADVAFCSSAKLSTIDPESNLEGSPDLVVEVLSPSNTAAEMADRERTCFAGGALEFWTVDPDQRVVRVTRRNRTFQDYRPGESISLEAFGGASFDVQSIFG
jgi:Uma2 family endonuclease